MGGLGRKFLHKLPDLEILRNLEAPFILWIHIDIYFLASTNYDFIDPREKIQFKVVGRMIGNAVPIVLARAIGRSIGEHIEEVRLYRESTRIEVDR